MNGPFYSLFKPKIAFVIKAKVALHIWFCDETQMLINLLLSVLYCFFNRFIGI